MDLTLLLQCNLEQEAPQFRDSSNAYFGGPHLRKVRTDSGALLLLNNSCAVQGIPRIGENPSSGFPMEAGGKKVEILRIGFGMKVENNGRLLLSENLDPAFTG